ncbi:MAG: MgtC/SapB family protein [Lachnospiraceae bacterium]
MIGSERKNRNKSAGIRTHMIIAMGSAHDGSL